MPNIARGQITITISESDHTFLKYSDDLETMYDKPSEISNTRYRPVDFILNTGNYPVYINNSSPITDKTRIVIDFEVTRVGNNTIAYIFGQYVGSTNNYYLRYNKTNHR